MGDAHLNMEGPWRTADNMVELVVSYHVVRDETQVIRLSSKQLYLPAIS